MHGDTGCPPALEPASEEVEAFLERLRSAYHAKRLGPLLRRTDMKNLRFLQGLGLSEELALRIVSELTPAHYSTGPLPDNNGDRGDYWVFGRDVRGKSAYIKLCETQARDMICGSFHEAERPLHFPFRESE
jgi:hypothetical protein